MHNIPNDKPVIFDGRDVVTIRPEMLTDWFIPFIPEAIRDRAVSAIRHAGESHLEHATVTMPDGDVLHLLYLPGLRSGFATIRGSGEWRDDCSSMSELASWCGVQIIQAD